MPRCCTHFSDTELAEVLGCYQIGTVSQSYPLSAGNSGAPKMVVVSDQGKFLLKRRAKGKNNTQRVILAHAVQNHLVNAGFPVSGVLPAYGQSNTLVTGLATTVLPRKPSTRVGNWAGFTNA